MIEEPPPGGANTREEGRSVMNCTDNIPRDTFIYLFENFHGQ